MKTRNLFLLKMFFSMLLLSGCYQPRADFTQEVVHEAETTVKSFIINNYQEVERVKVENVFRNSSGGMSVTGTVNKKACFHIYVDEYKFVIGSVETDETFPKLKEECRETICEY